MSEAAAVSVAVQVPIRHLLSYSVPDILAGSIEPGHRVLVPLGSRRVPGFVVAPDPEPSGVLKDIVALLDPIPPLTAKTLDLGLWVARHYGAPPGEALAALVPAPVRDGRGLAVEHLLRVKNREQAQSLVDSNAHLAAWAQRLAVLRTLLASGPISRTELRERTQTSASPADTLLRSGILELTSIQRGPTARLTSAKVAPPELTAEQIAALRTLDPLLARADGAIALLQGVTGSGKTEVYLRLLERNAAAGRAAILLVPEIALTPQTVERLLGRLPDLAVLHSNLSDADRAREWRRLRTGDVSIAVGPRSAIFAPLENVGLIILDEEHETTFKQGSSPRYHARDVAQRRAQQEGALLVLGSATPSLETLHGVAQRRIESVVLSERVGGRPMPTCTVIDMRRQKPVGPAGIYSRPLYLAIEETIDRREQVLLFLNRRGFSTAVLCRRCGYVARCDSCAINSTYHRARSRLVCHYCGQETEPPTECPECGQPGLLFDGFGTEKVAAVTAQMFPGARVRRADAETLRPRGAPQDLYDAMKNGTVDIVVGTQVVAKGLDIPAISLVGVISADTALLVPDFRSAERTFQLLCQVAGRAGRGDKPGRVLIQSHCPEHPAIQAAARHDQGRFATAELASRAELSYPPIGHLARVVVESPDETEARQAADSVGEEIRSFIATRALSLEVLGPAACPLRRLRGHFRFHLMVRAKNADVLTTWLSEHSPRVGGNARVLIDRDPVAVL